MAKIEASIAVVALKEENPLGEPLDVAGVRATCSACGHETESFGVGRESRKRCLALLREECPLGESNWYEEE
jgi:hypothetical protein